MKKLLVFLFMQIFTILHVHSQDIKTTPLPQNIIATQDLEPASIWHYFCNIAQIPRNSGNESGIASFIMECARQCGLSSRLDNVGNVIVKKTASSVRYANAPSIVIQAHMDMVCEKNTDTHHDFYKDPIKFVRKDNMLYAQGTTLGADNGVGVAAALAIMSSTKLPHGPLEFLFTTVEEAGFNGAYAVTPETFDGRMLINIDSEDEGSIFIGCAGGADLIGTLRIAREQASPNTISYAISINNLRGGHSGVDIDKDRINALKLAGEILGAFNGVDIRLISLQGGNKLNAIPRDAKVVFVIDRDQQKDFVMQAAKIQQELVDKYKTMESNLAITINKYASQDLKVITRNDQALILKLLTTIPHGVISMSSLVSGLVETSINLARIITEEDTISFATMPRGMISEKLDAIIQQTTKYMQEAGAHVFLGHRAPEWQPNERSLLLQLARKTYMTKFGKELEIKAIHAGLECGAFVRQVPNLDAISFGPTIIDAHSPNEHVAVDTVQPFWILLTELLKTIAFSNVG